MKIGTLKSVQQPTGGTINIEYEANTYTKAFYEKDVNSDRYHFAYNRIVAGGGLRIKKMKGAREISYNYDGGLCVIKPRFWYIKTIRSYQDGLPITIAASLADFFYLAQTSACTHTLSTLKGGNSFGYDEVTETFHDGSSVRYKYHNEEEEDDTHPFIHTNIIYLNGLLKSVEVINNRGYQSSLTEYDYSYKLSTDTVYAFFYNGACYPYKYQIKWPVLSTKHQITYDDWGLAVEHRDLFYNDNCFLTKEVISNYRNNDSYVKQYYYSNDFDTPVMRNMQERYMIGKPVKTLTMRKGLVVEGKKTDYAEQNGIIVPISENRIETSIPLSQENCETSFKEKNTLLRLHALRTPHASFV